MRFAIERRKWAFDCRVSMRQVRCAAQQADSYQRNPMKEGSGLNIAESKRLRSVEVGISTS